MTSEQKIVQYLNEAHALEAALVQTLTAHIAMTPEGPYRDLLERHLDETRAQAERILGRLSDLGESRNPLELIYGIAQTAIGQVIAAGKFPLDLIRGTGGEEKLLKNARDEAASEALEIATYDSLEAFATAAGDDKTAVLAREHRTQEEVFLADLREMIGELSRAVHAAEVDGDPSYELSTTGAAQAVKGVAGEVADEVEDAVEDAAETAGQVQAAAREAAADVQRTARRTAGAAEETVEQAADRVSRRARQAARGAASVVEEAADTVEDAAEAVQEAAAEDTGSDDSGSDAAPATSAGDDAPSAPIEGYDDLTVEQVLPKLRLMSQKDLAAVEAYETANRGRKRILDRVRKLRSSTAGQTVGTSRR
jgi:ferritin-like metal-binding protein YciE